MRRGRNGEALNVSKVSTKFVAIWATGLIAVCSPGCSNLELPEPPDMSKLVEAYENPDGMLDPDNPADLGDQVVAAVNDARTGAPIELSNKLAASLSKIGGNSQSQPDEDGEDGEDGEGGASSGAQTVAGSKIEVAAVVKVHHICGGWDNRIDEDINGSADVTLTLDRAGMIPTVWGELSRCRFERGDVDAELDGDIRIRFGTRQPRLALRALRTVGQFVDFEGSVKAMRGDEMLDVEVSSNFRFFLNGDVHINVNLADGTNVIGIIKASELTAVASTGRMQVGVITREDQWECTLDAIDRTGSCADSEDPETAVVQW
jgi:hypothetical protein